MTVHSNSSDVGDVSSTASGITLATAVTTSMLEELRNLLLMSDWVGCV